MPRHKKSRHKENGTSREAGSFCARCDEPTATRYFDDEYGWICNSCKVELQYEEDADEGL